MRVTIAILLALLLAGCAAILGIKPKAPTPFEHHAHSVKGITCLTCHQGISTAGDRDPLHLLTTEGCVACHKKPHDAHACDGCHGLPDTRESATRTRDLLRFQHKTHVARARGQCVRCHEGVASDSPVLRPTMAICVSSHGHRNQFAARACGSCHDSVVGQSRIPETHILHTGDFIREHGIRAASSRDLCSTCHMETFCANCHGVTVPTLPARLAFDDPLRPAIHRAGYRARHSAEARAQPGLCSTCHEPQRCEACHQYSKVAPGTGAHSPHANGWVGLRGERNEHGQAAWRDPVECASCHSGAGEALCIGCHKSGGIGGSPHRPGWSSRLNKRTDTPCRHCHSASP